MDDFMRLGVRVWVGMIEGWGCGCGIDFYLLRSCFRCTRVCFLLHERGWHLGFRSLAGLSVWKFSSLSTGCLNASPYKIVSTYDSSMMTL